jgi:hypothetical protein
MHHSLYYASIDVIYMLLQAYPKAVEVQQKDGWLPLPYALCYSAFDDVI